MRKDTEDGTSIDERLTSLQGDLRVLKWQCVAVLVLTGVLLFQTFCDSLGEVATRVPGHREVFGKLSG